MRNKKGYVLSMLSGMLVMVLAYVVVVQFSPGFLSGSSKTPAPTPTATPAPTYGSIGAKVDEIVGALSDYYVEEIDMDDFADKIYREIVNLFKDPYTFYMDPEQHKDFVQESEGVYPGIGVQVRMDIETNRILVSVPFEGYPGALAGMLPDDAIIKVNGHDVTGDTMQEAVNMMKGEPGTSVDVTVHRDSTGETFDLTIVRQIINVPTVSHKMMEDDIGYIRITQFERVTYDQFAKAYEELTSQNMKGLILDLRNNPGGYLGIVNQITDLLVPEGIIVYTEDKNGRRVNTPSNSRHIEVPLLVIVNGNSASASEVLSGAVRDHGIGELVGTTTFGKGLVQNLYTLADKSAIKITTARYYTPNGVCIQDVGLVPDYEIDMDPELTVRLTSLILEEDVQLKRAIEIMVEKIK